MSSLFGWLSPRGDFTQCDQWEHCGIARTDAAAHAVPGVAEQLADVDNVRQACQALCDAGEHGEWHCLDFAQGDARDEIAKLLYKAGWLRVGTEYTETRAIHFEGTADGITNLMQRAKDFAEERGKAAKFTSRKL